MHYELYTWHTQLRDQMTHQKLYQTLNQLVQYGFPPRVLRQNLLLLIVEVEELLNLWYGFQKLQMENKG